MKLKEFGPGGRASKILLCRSATARVSRGWGIDTREGMSQPYIFPQ